jgi:hypothetical protein
MGIDQRDGSDKQLIGLEAGERELEAVGFDQLIGLELRRSIPGGGIESGFDVSASLQPHGDICRAVVCYEDSVGGLDRAAVVSILAALYDCYGYSYGYAYQREVEKGPYLYAYGLAGGLGYSDVDQSERRQIGKWMNAPVFLRERGEYFSDHLRDVYPYSVLSEVHLRQRVQGRDLRTCISQPGWGTLEVLTSDLWLWSVRHDEQASIRQVLMDSGLLIAYRRDIPPVEI